jgi:hypothetical protein
MREALYDPYLDFDEDDLEIDPYLQWEALVDSSESPPMDFAGDPAVVIEPLRPELTRDAYGRVCTSLTFRLVPYVPADTRWIAVFAVDNEYNTWLIGNQAVLPPDGDEGGYVRVEGMVPYDTWTLTDQEEMLTFAMLYFPSSTDPEDIQQFAGTGAEGTFELDEVVDLLEWSFSKGDAGVVFHTLRVEEAESILEALGWD